MAMTVRQKERIFGNGNDGRCFKRSLTSNKSILVDNPLIFSVLEHE